MKIASFKKAPIRLHSSFWILAGMFVLWQYLEQGFSAALMIALFGLMLFGSVLIHEIAHAFAASQFGIKTRHITLYPFGGIAMIERSPQGLREEIYIAGAGPAINFVIGTISVLLAFLQVPLAFEMAVINLGMGLFNMIPAFPMDGGRIFRGLLLKVYSPVQATKISLYVSGFIAVIFLITGFLIGWLGLALVGGFLLFAIRHEYLRIERF